MFLTGDPECTLDESKNVEGPNRCVVSTECSGARTCSAWGWCQGVSGCPATAPEVDACNYDESTNPLGPNRCSVDTECAGARECSEWGWCEGDSGCESGDACNYDESKNPLGPNRCVKKE